MPGRLHRIRHRVADARRLLPLDERDRRAPEATAGEPGAERARRERCLDGGVDPTTAPRLAEAGADVLVAGSAVFRGGSVSNSAPYGENIRAIRAAAEAALT